MSEVDIQDKILSAIDIAMRMVLESDGKYTHNTITIPIELTTTDTEYELVVTFREKVKQ